jgi:hypothetical protein
MKRIINGKTYTIEPEMRGHTRGQAIYEGSGLHRKLVGFTYRKADGWYCHGAGCQVPEHYGGGLMKDAMKSMIKGRR